MYTKEKAIKMIAEYIDNPSYMDYNPRFRKDDICAVLKCFADHDCDYVEYKTERYYLNLNRGELEIDSDPFSTFKMVPYSVPVPRKKAGKPKNNIQFRSLI